MNRQLKYEHEHRQCAETRNVRLPMQALRPHDRLLFVLKACSPTFWSSPNAPPLPFNVQVRPQNLPRLFGPLLHLCALICVYV